MEESLYRNPEKKKAGFLRRIYRSRMDFIRRRNAKNLKIMIRSNKSSRLERIIAGIAMFVNYPISYCISYLIIRYSPKHKGYVEIA